MDKIALNVEKKMANHESLHKWEVIIWLDHKLQQAQEDGKAESFEDVIEKLPLAITLAFNKDHYHVVIFKIHKTAFTRIVEGRSESLPRERIFPREIISGPLQELIKKENNNMYIENASLDPRAHYMAELVKDAHINDIYFRKVEAFSGLWVIMVDGLYPQKITTENKEFLDVLCQKIQKISIERAEIQDKIFEKVVKTQQGTIVYLLNLLMHLFRNKITSMGGLCRRIDKIALNGNNGSCEGCSVKTKNVVKEAGEIENILNQFDNALADIKKATVLNLETVSLIQLINDIQVEDTSRDSFVELKGPQDDFVLFTDKRKTVKAICRIVNKLAQNNKMPIHVSAKRVKNGKVKVFLKQKEIDTENLVKLVNIHENGNAKDHSMNDFMVLISSSLLVELGAKLEIGKSMVAFTFLEVNCFESVEYGQGAKSVNF